MYIVGTIVDTETADGPMAILHKRPAAGTWPTVLMFHDGPGIRTATHVFSEKLASAGYDVIVPDLFHRHGRLIGFDPAQRDADPSIRERMMGMVLGLTDDGIQADGAAALTALGVETDRPLATIGFCLGARAVAVALLRQPERFVAGAMWHPSFLGVDKPGSPLLTGGQLGRPLCVGVGGADQMQPLSAQQPFLDDVPADLLDLEVYDGADHGFTWPDHPSYHERAATDSFERTTALFGKALAA